MDKKEKILQLTRKQGKIKTKEVAKEFNVSRQYANLLVKELVDKGHLLKIGSTKTAVYVLPSAVNQNTSSRLFKRLENKKLEEHIILNEIERGLPSLLKLNENISSVFNYAFSEMLNNAIEHSESKDIELGVIVENKKLSFFVNDFGIGVFRNIMKSKRLKSELDAITQLLKGKTTTKPKSHSGEGIFFTSKIGDIFSLESYGYKLIVDNNVSDIFVEKVKERKKGTKVNFSISVTSAKHLNDIFKAYTDIVDKGALGFDKTEIKVKLYALGGIYISRSQARRILSNLDKFKFVILDFDQVPVVGQAFADEIFRVFVNKFPNIKISSINMVDSVKFMIDRAKNKKE